MPKIFGFIIALLVTSCASYDGYQTFHPQTDDPQQAALYIYRPPAMQNAIYAPDLYIDDELKLAVKNGSKARLTVAPGKHHIVLDADNNQSRQNHLSLDLAPATTHYLRVTTSLKIKNATSYEPYQRNYILQEVDSAQAIDEIAACCNDQHTNTKKAGAAEPQEQITNDGFSVDKTQNPFSH